MTGASDRVNNEHLFLIHTSFFSFQLRIHFQLFQNYLKVSLFCSPRLCTLEENASISSRLVTPYFISTQVLKFKASIDLQIPHPYPERRLVFMHHVVKTAETGDKKVLSVCGEKDFNNRRENMMRPAHLMLQLCGKGIFSFTFNPFQ